MRVSKSGAWMSAINPIRSVRSEALLVVNRLWAVAGDHDLATCLMQALKV